MRPWTSTARTQVVLAASAGVVGDELVYLAVRSAGVGYWSPTSLAGSVVVAVLALVAIAVATVLARDGTPPVPGRWLAAASGLVVACSYVGFRLTQVVLSSSGVPNDQRSLILAGYEIHHASTGSLLLLVAVLLLGLPGLTRRLHRFATVAFAFGCGFVADQYPYLFYPVMTDELYFGSISFVGGAVASVIVITFFVAQYHLRSKGRRDEH